MIDRKAYDSIDAKIPQIENTGKTELEDRVNLEIQKVMYDCLTASEERAKEYYDAFVETGGDPKDFVPVGIMIDYETKYISQITGRNLSWKAYLQHPQ